MENTSLSYELADMLRSAARDIPSDVRHQTRLHIADSAGIALAARSTALAADVIRAQSVATGNGDAPVFGGGSAAPLSAAYINAALVHILDYDDIHDEGRLHPSAVILPAVLAVSKIVPLSGEAVVNAVALGNELICRLGKVCAPQGEGPGSEWFLTQLFGYVAAAAAASQALGLTVEQSVSAMGLAYMQAAGGKQAGFGTGANARAVYPAFAAQGGVQAAMLAREGLIGPEASLDGAAGLFRLYLGGPLSSGQRMALLDDTAWHFRDVELKPWPSCRLSHPYIAVALAAHEQFAAGLDARIRLAVNASAARLCRPLAQRCTPDTLQDAKYSIPFMTAFTLLHGEPSLGNLSDEVLNDHRVIALAQGIELDDNLPDNAGHPLAILTLDTRKAGRQEYRFAASDLQMNEAAAYRKFEACLEQAAMPLDAAATWEQLLYGDVLTAINALCPAVAGHLDHQSAAGRGA